jgi:hypothetical protein
MKLAEAVGVKPTAYIVHPESLFLVNKRLLQQILPINEDTRTWLTFSQFRNVGYTAFSSGRLGLQCE